MRSWSLRPPLLGAGENLGQWLCRFPVDDADRATQRSDAVGASDPLDGVTGRRSRGHVGADHGHIPAVGREPPGDVGRPLVQQRRTEQHLRAVEQPPVEPTHVAVGPGSVARPDAGVLSPAVGSVRSATIAVSEGLLDALDDEELDAVLAHELAHVRNRDAAVMTLASFLPALTNGEYRPLEVRLGTWGRRALLAVSAAVAGALLAPFVVETTGTITIGAVAVLAGATYLLTGVALGVLTTPVVYLGRSLSRYREFAADEAAAQITGEPAALDSALQQLGDEATASPAADKRIAYEGVRGLCFLPHGFGNETDRSKFYVEIRSHPPTDERVERLKSVAGS